MLISEKSLFLIMQVLRGWIFNMFELILIVIWILLLAGCIADCGGCVFLVGTFVFVVGFIVTHI